MGEYIRILGDYAGHYAGFIEVNWVMGYKKRIYRFRWVLFGRLKERGFLLTGRERATQEVGAPV